MLRFKLNFSESDFRKFRKQVSASTLIEAVRECSPILAKNFEEELKAGTPVDTGTARNSWYHTVSGTSTGAVIEEVLNVHYGWFLEFGSRPGAWPWPRVGPRTVLHQGRIYSSQAPGGFTEKAFKSLKKDEFLRAVFEYVKRR